MSQAVWTTANVFRTGSWAGGYNIETAQFYLDCVSSYPCYVRAALWDTAANNMLSTELYSTGKVTIGAEGWITAAGTWPTLAPDTK